MPGIELRLWSTWWLHGRASECVELDGAENGHWTHMRANPALVSAEPGFADFLAAFDVDEDMGARDA